jgi:CBS domain-containing protein
MLVRDIMTSPAVTIQPDDEVVEAARVLDRLSLTSLPVVGRDRQLLGIISEADVIGLTSAEPDAPDGRSPVSSVMTSRVVTVSADDDLSTVMGLMRGTLPKSVPVVLHERVVGMVSRRDVVRVIAHGDLDAPAEDLSPV